jgi:DNA modification methylase
LLEVNKIYNMDCLEGMKYIEDKSIDMILCDLPYGTTACKWDTVIPFEPLWKQYERIIKDNGAIALTGSQPFTSILNNSNLKLFRYELIWEKNKPSNFMLANKQPMKYHENISIFYKKQPIYNKQMIQRSEGGKQRTKYKGSRTDSEHYYLPKKDIEYNPDLKNPSSIIKINCEYQNKNLHPTQKPVALFEYLIKTYTNEGELVLDNCIGSGTTAIACINTNRNYIGFELDKKYYELANERIRQHIK